MKMFQKNESRSESLNLDIQHGNDQTILRHYNKNDTFYLFNKAFNSIDNIFLYFYSSISFHLKSFINKKIVILKKYFYIPFLLTLLFSLTLSQNIPRDLLINAYFNDSQITHISYDNIIKGKYADELNNNNLNKFNKDINTCKACYDYQENKDKEIYDDSQCEKKNDSSNNKDCNNDQQDKEYYLLNIFPVKRILITVFSFFSLYIIIKTTYYSRINNSFFINSIGVYTSYKILAYLYFSTHYLASGIVFILFFYFFKCSIDSIYLILKFKRSDFEIFSIHLTATNSRQFILKFIVLFSGTLISGLLSGFLFQLYFNYMAFYICLFTFIIFLCNCVENELLEDYKYIKNVLIFCFGLINFIVNKLLKNKYYDYKDCLDKIGTLDEFNFFHFIDYLMIPTNYSNTNSFYMISDIFTLLCFDYIDDYIEYKYRNFLDKTKKNKKIYNSQDIIFHCLFIVSIGLSISGIIIKEYICFLLSLNISQKFNTYFSTIFNHNLSRILNHIILLIYIITQYEISTTGDEYLISLMLNTRLSKDIIQIILKIFGLLIFLYYLIYSNYIYYYSNNSHQVFYHYYSGFDVAKNTNDNCENNNNDVNNNNQNDSSNSEEGDDLLYEENQEINDDIRDNLFEFASQINSKKYKIKIIHSNNDENNNTIFYLTNEIILCYIDTCIIIIFIITYESNIIMKLIYGLIIMFLNSRKYFILNEIKNNGQYFFYYLISFFFAIRLIVLTNTNSLLLNYLAHINVFILLVYYCCINKRNYFLSLILLFHLILAYSNLKSNFIIFDIISVLLFLLVKNLKNKKKYRVEKYEEPNNNLSLIFLLSLLGFFLVQLYGINRLCDLIQDIFNKITNIFDNMSLMMSYGKNKDKKAQPIEYYIITDFINWIDKK